MGDDEAPNDVAWMYGDAGSGWLASLNPMRWSKALTFKECLEQLKDVKENDDRPILLCMPADGPGVDTPDRFENVKGAMKAIMKNKKAQTKAAKKGETPEESETRKTREKAYKKAFGQKRPDIRHIVTLMLENRTFDGVQGQYMQERYDSGEVERSQWDQDGQDLYSYVNQVEGPDGPVDFPVWSWAGDDADLLSKDNMSIPAGPAGPVEKFHFLNMCTYGVMRPEQSHIDDGPNMAGFAQQYYTKEKANTESYPKDDAGDDIELLPGIAGTDFDPESTTLGVARSPVMHVYRKEQMCVLTDLMEAFACSDTHFSSAPCQTWPNRLFASCATCYGYYNNLPYVNPNGEEDELVYFQSEAVDKVGAFQKMMSSYDLDTVFHRLEANGVTWGIYHGQAALAVITTKLKHELWDISDNVGTLEEFAADVETNDLPEFVWLEPNYDPASPAPNDMHPPANVLHGEKLIKDVYNILRSNEDVWNHCLFIITCDEGVGSFDHVKPPAAVDPVNGHDHEYEGFQVDGHPDSMTTNPFTRFGTRVPNLIISPFVNPRTVVRPKGPSGEEGDAPYPFDHTSIIRTAFDLFLADPEMCLTERDRAAPSFVHCLESEIVNPGPERIECPDFDDTPGERNKHTCHGLTDVTEMMKTGFGGTQMDAKWTTQAAAMFGI